MKQSTITSNYDKNIIKNNIHLKTIISDYMISGKKMKVDVGYIYEDCPFCSHKNHFQVDITKNLYNSFNGCCKGGDVIKFMMEIEGIGFKDAITKLGDRFNIGKTKFERTQSKRELEILTLLTKHQDYQLEKEINKIFDFLIFMEYEKEFWKCISMVGTPELNHYCFGLKGRYEI